jgi:hypothetical protein
VTEIQDPVKYPEIRVVYSSATAAGEVRHLAYQIRLGLWGMGTSFPLGFAQFAEEIESPKTRARAWWTDEQRKIPPTMRKTIHLLSGALLPIWKSLKKLQQDG